MLWKSTVLARRASTAKIPKLFSRSWHIVDLSTFFTRARVLNERFAWATVTGSVQKIRRITMILCWLRWLKSKLAYSGTKVPVERNREQKFPRTFVPGNKSSNESSQELSLPGAKVPGNFRSWERKFSVGTFAPRSENTEERKVLIPVHLFAIGATLNDRLTFLML